VADADITAAIEMLLSNKKGLTTHLITVRTQTGIVELTGFADSLLARQRAEDAVLTVCGVCGLHNELAVIPTVVADAELQGLVTQALAHDPATAEYPVQCVASQGIVMVSGSVQSWTEKQLVLRVLAGVRGVEAIRAERLFVRSPEVVHSDEQITTQLRELLDWDVRLDGALVAVRTSQQAVQLSGTVGSAAEKARVVALAYQSGAARVDARDLSVAYWTRGREQRRAPAASQTDESIAQAVHKALLLNPRVRSSETLVQVRHGVVTLAGTVSTLRTKQEAEQDARHVAGVRDVHNLLKVRTEQSVPDEGIAQPITAALARDPYVGTVAFGIQVYCGRVLLTGRVTSHEEQQQAGDIAAGVSGVAAVDNQVDVSPDWPGSAATKARELSDQAPEDTTPDRALARRIGARFGWSANLRDQKIEVQVDHGVVTLTGTVDTWSDLAMATRLAREAGACDITNGLHVLTAMQFVLGLPLAIGILWL
jgi:osmotically-inducible protein OsmY